MDTLSWNNSTYLIFNFMIFKSLHCRSMCPKSGRGLNAAPVQISIGPQAPFIKSLILGQVQVPDFSKNCEYDSMIVVG